MMLNVGNQAIADIFSILHDGEVVHHRLDGTRYEIDVKIDYLTKLINPEFTVFILVLSNVSVFELSNSLETRKWEGVFSAISDNLTILDSAIVDELVHVVTNYGTLLIKADGVSVTDEAGKQYTVDELSDICRNYWDTWKLGVRRVTPPD